MRSLGVSDEKGAERLAREFTDSRGNVIVMDNPGQRKYAGTGSTLSMALLNAAENYRSRQRRECCVINAFSRAARLAESRPDAAWWALLSRSRGTRRDEDAFEDLFAPACFEYGSEGDDHRETALCPAGATRAAGAL